MSYELAFAAAEAMYGRNGATPDDISTWAENVSFADKLLTEGRPLEEGEYAALRTRINAVMAEIDKLSKIAPRPNGRIEAYHGIRFRLDVCRLFLDVKRKAESEPDDSRATAIVLRHYSSELASLRSHLSSGNIVKLPPGYDVKCTNELSDVGRSILRMHERLSTENQRVYNETTADEDFEVGG
jgi:hypothetical protein